MLQNESAGCTGYNLEIAAVGANADRVIEADFRHGAAADGRRHGAVPLSVAINRRG